jgi:ABC-type dipeptide/oligopeptide/nickel transport system permease component
MKFAMYLAKRTVASVFAVLGALCLIFLISHVLPGNPVLSRATAASAGTIRQVEQQLGLNRPLGTQFVDYFSGLAHGNLGDSYVTGRSVGSDLAQRAPASIELALFATLLALLVSLPLGIYAAVHQGTLIDRVARALSSLAVSMPSFWLALLFIYVFYFKLSIGAAPLGRLDATMTSPPNVTGLYTVDSLISGQFDIFANALWHLVLPGATLAIVVMAPLVRITRATMLEVLTQPFINCGRALGLSEHQVIFHDALRNSLASVLTVAGLVFGYLVSGSVLVEQIFAWPGIGQFAFSALTNNDIQSLEGFVLVVAILYVGVNWLVDLLYGVIDPRVRV